MNRRPTPSLSARSSFEASTIVFGRFVFVFSCFRGSPNYGAVSMGLVRRIRVGPSKGDPPALAVIPRAAGQRHVEHETRGGPLVRSAPVHDRDDMRGEQVVGAVVLAV